MDETTALGAEALLATEVSERIAIDGHALHELHRRGQRTKRFGVGILALGAAFAVIALGLFVYAQLNAPLTTFSDIDVPASYGTDQVEVEASSAGGAYPYAVASEHVLSLIESPIFSALPVLVGALMLGVGLFRGDVGRMVMGAACMAMGLTFPHVVRTIVVPDGGSIERPIPAVVALARDQKWNDVLEQTRSVPHAASSYVCSQAAYLAGSNGDLRECLSRLKERPRDVGFDARRVATMARRAGMESLAAEYDRPLDARYESAQGRVAVSASVAGLLLLLGTALTLFARQLLRRHQRLTAHCDSPVAAEQPI